MCNIHYANTVSRDTNDGTQWGLKMSTHCTAVITEIIKLWRPHTHICRQLLILIAEFESLNPKV